MTSGQKLNILKASYVVALRLAQQCRPYNDGIFVKNLFQDVLKCFGEDAENISLLVNNIRLSSSTIQRRTTDISNFLFCNLKKRLEECLFFSISLDESTDVSDTSQLIIYVKTVHANFETFEDFLALVPMYGHVNGETLWKSVQEKVLKIAGKNKLSAVCTDGANVMVGKRNGLIGLLSQHIDVPSFHCIIHQQALFAKHLCLNDVMKICVQIINKIRGGHHSLSHRKFKNFLKEVEADYGDLLLFTEVRWLSRGRSLERFFELRGEILEFLKLDKSPDCKIFVLHLSNNDFIIRLAFLCDICKMLNELNLVLQGKNKHIFELFPLINHFNRKLCILNNQLTNKNLKSLQKTASLDLSISDTLFQEFLSINQSILNNMNNRFKDFQKISPLIDLHNNTFACDVQIQNPAIQEEVKEMLEDMSLPLATGKEFWEKISREKYPNSLTEIYKLYSMFASTYNCEHAFSLLKIIKSKQRNSLRDANLENLMRIKLNTTEIDIDELVQHLNT